MFCPLPFPDAKDSLAQISSGDTTFAGDDASQVRQRDKLVRRSHGCSPLPLRPLIFQFAIDPMPNALGCPSVSRPPGTLERFGYRLRYWPAAPEAQVPPPAWCTGTAGRWGWREGLLPDRNSVAHSLAAC